MAQRTAERHLGAEEARFKTDTDQPIGKVIELIGHSREGIEQAIEDAVALATETIDHVSAVEVRRMSAKVSDGKIREWVVDMKLVFGVERRGD